MLAYSPLWEPLSSALARIVLSGVAESEAKAELASAIAERQVAIRVLVQSADPDVGGQVLDSGSVSAPKDLTDHDLDWSASRPNAAWETGPSNVEGITATWRWKPRPIEWVEVSTDDVTCLWCADGERLARRAVAQAEPIPDLPEWFSAMEAIAWIVSREPRIVSYADPERAAKRTFFVEHYLPSGKRTEAREGSGPGLTLGWLDNFAASHAGTIPRADIAMTEFMKALRTGRVVARGIWALTGERRDMGNDEWRNLTLEPGENERVLLPYRTIPGRLGQLLETRWQDILFSKSFLIGLWPPPELVELANEPTVAGTVAAERRLTAWLVDLMRGNPDKPMSKAAVRALASEKGYKFGGRGFQRAWANAVLNSGASKWAEPGRKSKRRIDTRS